MPPLALENRVADRPCRRENHEPDECFCEPCVIHFVFSFRLYQHTTTYSSPSRSIDEASTASAAELPQTTLDAESEPVLEPHTTLNPLITELPQTTDVPQTTELPETLVPHTTELPQTTEVP